MRLLGTSVKIFSAKRASLYTEKESSAFKRLHLPPPVAHSFFPTRPCLSYKVTSPPLLAHSIAKTIPDAPPPTTAVFIAFIILSRGKIVNGFSFFVKRKNPRTADTGDTGTFQGRHINSKTKHFKPVCELSRKIRGNRQFFVLPRRRRRFC